MSDPVSLALGLFSLGVNLWGSNKARAAAEQQSADYQIQAEINRQIGAFNAQVAEITGEDAVSAIADETSKLIGKQKVAFARHGIEMVGTPYFVLGETYRMGLKKAQQAYFNAQVQKINAQHTAATAVAASKASASNYSYQALSHTLNLFQNFMDGVQMVQSHIGANATPSQNPPNIFSLEAQAERIVVPGLDPNGVVS